MKNVRGKCLDNKGVVGLTVGNIYYLLIHNNDDELFCEVARTDNSQSGLYYTSRFKILEEE